MLFLLLVIPLVGMASARPMQGRIVGGRNATIEEFPYQVSVEFLYTHRCGGSLISPSVVLTAAHCVDGLHEHLSYFRIRAGTNIINSKEGVTSFVSQIHQHPSFTENYDFDIAVLILETKLQLSSTVQIIPLLTPEMVVDAGDLATATGWGALREGGRGSKILQAVDVPKIDGDLCSVIYPTFTERMVCYGFSNGGKDACQGDSGGPLMHTIGNQPYLAGVVSWGDGCAKKGFPGVYADVSYLDIYEYIHGYLT